MSLFHIPRVSGKTHQMDAMARRQRLKLKMGPDLFALVRWVRNAVAKEQDVHCDGPLAPCGYFLESEVLALAGSDFAGSLLLLSDFAALFPLLPPPFPPL